VVQQGHIEDMAVRNGWLSFRVKNTGNVHFVEQAVRVRGFGPAEDSLAAQHQRAVMALSINLSDKEEILVILRDGDVLARISDLEQAGLDALAGQREVFGGESYVSLASLAPAITYEVDEKTLTLRLTVSPGLLPSTVLNLGSGRPPGITYSQSTSAFLNYALNWPDLKRLDAFGEAGISLGGNLLSRSFSRNPDGLFVRGFTSLILDERDSLRRWVIGDRFANTGILGGGAFLGGVSVSREFTLDPYVFRYPALGLSGAVLTPSTVDLYVNGILLRREQLPPGPFELRNRRPCPHGRPGAARGQRLRERTSGPTSQPHPAVCRRGLSRSRLGAPLWGPRQHTPHGAGKPARVCQSPAGEPKRLRKRDLRRRDLRV